MNKGPVSRALLLLRMPRGRLLRGLELDRAAGGDRRADRLEAPAVHGGEGFAIEHARRRGADHARGGNGAVGAYGELDLDPAGATPALPFARLCRRRQVDRDRKSDW